MALTDTLLNYARTLGAPVRNAFAPAPAENDALGSFYGANPEAQEMFGLIEARIDEARSIADARGDRPTLEDYRQACVAFGETPQGQAMASDGRWNAKVYSNLSGQMGQGANATGHNLSGFALSEPQKRAMSDLMDLDSDGAISTFYTNIDFTGANLNKAYVDPATSFNEEIARAKNLEGLTFNNMREGDRFEFGAGNYTNINMTNINGGEIVFGENSRVDGLTINGLSASIAIGTHASVNNITVNDNFRIVNLAMGEGAVLSGSDLTNATISMASEFAQGATLQNVKLGSNVAGLDFSGLRLNNVSIDGVPIGHASDLAQFGIGYDSSTVASVSPEMARNHELDRIRATMQEQVASIGTSTTAPAQTAKVIAPLAEANPNDTLNNLARANDIANVNAANNPNDMIAAIRASAAATAITFGGDANFNTVTQTAAVTSQPRTVPAEEQASGANMQRNA